MGQTVLAIRKIVFLFSDTSGTLCRRENDFDFHSSISIEKNDKENSAVCSLPRMPQSSPKFNVLLA